MLTQIGLAIVGVLILIAALFYYHHTVYRDGFEDAQHQYQVKEENTRIEAEKRLAEAVQAEKDKRAALQIEINNISTRRQREQDNANAELQTLRAGLAAGTRRVSVPSVSPRPLFGDTAPATPAAAARTQPEARCELAPSVASALERIASDGDDAIRDRNALIDIYDAARAAQ